MRLRFPALFFLSIYIFATPFGLFGNQALRLIDNWNHDDLIYGFILGAVINNDSDLIVMFFRNGIKIADKYRYSVFARAGMGPDEVNDFTALCLYRDKIAEIELHRKINIFSKVDGKYKCQQTIWREERGCNQKVTSAIFFKGKWYFAGQEYDFLNSKENKYYFLRICNENGEYIKHLISRKYSISKRLNLMSFYVSTDQKSVYFIAEDDPTIFIISPDSLRVTRKIKLELPEFYVPMPEDFYSKEIKSGSSSGFTMSDFYTAFEKWKSNYSRITNAIIEDGKFIIQIRTCSEKLARFALIFYNLSSFKQENIVFTNDYLLASKSGKYYMFQNGNPMIDEDAGDFSVNIYDLHD